MSHLEKENKSCKICGNSLHCFLCDVSFTNIKQYQEHLQGVKHFKKCKKKKQNQLSEGSTSNQQYFVCTVCRKSYFCEICNKRTTSSELLNQHFMGKKHQNKLQQYIFNKKE